MHQVSDELKENGFSITLVSDIIERNNFSRKFNTLEYFAIYLVAEDLNITVEHKPYHIPGGNSVFIGPQKKVEFGNALGKEIYAIVFTKEFFDKTSKDSIYLNSSIFFNSKSHIFVAPYFGNNDYNKIILIERLKRFSAIDEKNIYFSAAHNAIESLILDAHLHIDHKNDPKEHLESVSLVNRFTVILQRDYKIEKKVSHYADELRVSSRKLTDMTEFVYGKSAKQMIIEKVRFECEKAIKFSNKTLSEIAFDLGFKDEGNFTNFVKKHSGKKPSDMREMIG
ncbi:MULTISPECIES: helix-turn-helix domain-containing protein [Chryseobacterium]|uniref:helix-turn-helix domain-containing protein n=1 Tax=Chryseobacterium TaxID=59732 RepID=UPI00195E6316|nr:MULTISPECIES: helix-turn-helix domain-containing protein [Chryseobacterium]MBM7420688.1 AraC-like DNA-binding protein [Chryseobacterium sp. JUb44]MDH6210641.1 AraC family transcriptional activator of pobA [Chryseobacterium sp. BIGb0186]WSO09324.1 helix-turn-helix domain-containing protein [Chryseobacterium scophthalmum]